MTARTTSTAKETRTTTRPRAAGATLTTKPLGPSTVSEGVATTLGDAIFRATHNSYAGGSVGTVSEQLDAGVRGIELDVWIPVQSPQPNGQRHCTALVGHD